MLNLLYMVGVKPIGGTFEDIQEEVTTAVIEPIKDQVGEAIEAGVQSVIAAKPITPQQKQQKKQEEQKGLIEARRKIAWWQNLSADQQKVREEEKQRIEMKKQQEEQVEQQKAQSEQVKEQNKAAEVNPALAAATNKSETKKGLGG
jgi:hypothetical protein